VIYVLKSCLRIPKNPPASGMRTDTDHPILILKDSHRKRTLASHTHNCRNRNNK